MPRFFTALALLALTSAALPLHAQEAPIATEVSENARVRVVQRSAPYRITGRLVAADSGHITVNSRGALLTVPTSQVRRIEVSRGRPRGGAVSGAAAGFLGSALLLGLFYVAGGAGDCEDCMFTLRGAAVEAAVPFTLGMTVFGAVTGATLPGRERWTRITPPVHVRADP